jgi:hypothetical protein
MFTTDFLDTEAELSRPIRIAAPRLWRDLSKDWRRWTTSERIIAAGLVLVLVASLAAAIHGAV